MTILAVAISRVVLTAHWPLDTVGGAALGLICVAAVEWWHQNHPPVPGRSSRPMSFAFQNWVDGWKLVVAIYLSSSRFLARPANRHYFGTGGRACPLNNPVDRYTVDEITVSLVTRRPKIDSL
jgi:hypothetical protein